MTLTVPLLAELGLQPWRQQAACRTEGDNDPWYPRRGQIAVQARRICAGCPVLPQCLEYALSRREKPGVWGGAAWRRRRRLAVVWIQRAHDYRDDCTDPKCRWCRTVDEHRASLTAVASPGRDALGRIMPSETGPMWLNGPGARCGFRSTYVRGCRCGPCSLAISATGAKLRACGHDIMTWWLCWFGDNTDRRLVWRARLLAQFDITEKAA